MNYTQLPNKDGFYGAYGGAFIPEILYPNVKALQNIYQEILEDVDFQDEFNDLLKNYVGRPTPLYEAKRLSAHLGFRIFLKREDLCHTGAHKINNTIGQILIAGRMGKKRIIAETGAGQHGVATATVCALKGLECIVYMGEHDMQRQSANVARMRMLGATVIPARSGSKTLKDATNEAIRDWISHAEDTHYIIGSAIGPHPYPDLVSRLQSVISKEIRIQLQDQLGRSTPDYVLACVGGGSNAAGAMFDFLDDENVTLILAEAAGKGINSGKTAATSQIGKKGVIHGCMTLLMQDRYGQITEPYSLSAGLDYPGIGPLHAHLIDQRRVQVLSATDDEALNAVMELSRLEGIIPALESAHALAVLPKMSISKEEVVVVSLSGRGDKDLGIFMEHLNMGEI
ncbi:MAG: tryptophan synthase subunit beta [Saprospiraceae bacterium]|jgi:tryptophan synthase beta chain|nr:tryptophan synthase subunit beta [Saprospiraceae bacterium]MBP9193914.1 tryptophan synthase subunit beta [Saprospiraceae bacterium]